MKNTKDQILEEIEKNPHTGCYISSEYLGNFPILNEHDQLTCINAAAKNPVAIVQLAAIVNNPALQKNILNIIDNSSLTNKTNATKAIINNAANSEVIKQALYTSFNMTNSEQEFKKMWEMSSLDTLDVCKINNEAIKGRNEGMQVDEALLAGAYKAMSSQGKPLDKAKQTKLEQNTEFRGFFDKIVNAIKDFLGISVATETRATIQKAVRNITSKLTDDKNTFTDDKNTFKKGNSLGL